ncbi:hypothetical protein O9K51_03887 [Purpureocillium lavendulum]|uniref:Uncharacterized protein n=1 Tax=Purpureocillium lavendulum TaxID=1247861 RepID=A0AB34FWH3_9HYPO|nr:hypothetical protein O9K51_03887 [Purpureocillium lavendulum]
MQMEDRELLQRRFQSEEAALSDREQLGGSSRQIEVINIATAARPTAQRTEVQSMQRTLSPMTFNTVASTWSVSEPISTIAASIPVSRPDDVTETATDQFSSKALQAVLKLALKDALNISAPAIETRGQPQPVFALDKALSPIAFNLAVGSQSGALSQTITATAKETSAGQSVGLDHLAEKAGQEDPSFQVLPILTPVSSMVAQSVAVDVNATLGLVNSVLQALPIDASAASSVLPELASQKPDGMEEILPLLIPTIADLLGQNIEQAIGDAVFA